MAKSSTYSFGSGNSVSFTQNELLAGSQYFTTTNSELSAKLGTEIARGEFSVADGLVGFDTFPAFTSQPGTVSIDSSGDSTSASTSSNPSTRPYIWKYQ